jgi:uncharacterized protein (DUF433 family)
MKGHAMDDQELIARIAANPKVMFGKPVIRGTRLTVGYILDRLAHQATPDDLLHEYPGLTREDIEACYLFASQVLENTAFMPLALQPGS